MNDQELDEMLDQWKAPAARAELKERVAAGFAALRDQPRKRFIWPAWNAGKGLFTGVAAAALVFLAVLAQAFPQSFGLVSPSRALHAPYVVVSNVVDFARDGSSRTAATVLSYSYKGTEIVISEHHPDNPVQEFIRQFHNGMHLLLLRYVPGLVLPETSAREAWFSAYVQSECVGKGDIPVGHETILGHTTTAVQQIYPDGWRGTAWRAPDLGCFALRSKSEEPAPGGSFRLVSQREAARVLMMPQSR